MSDKPILQKLLLKPGYRAAVLNAPESYYPVLDSFPKDVELVEVFVGKFDFIHYFATKKAELEREVPDLKEAMKPTTLLWISYPKGKAIPTDLNRDSLAKALAEFGLQPVAMVAIDDVWSAMRFKIA